MSVHILGALIHCTVKKKVSDFCVPSRDVVYCTKLSLVGNNLIISVQGELGQ
jgi:hypothetical protein